MQTLFELLTDNITNKIKYFDNLTLYKSIKNHLILLFNSRQGSLQHLPNYGLPDLHKIYQDLPHSLHIFTRHLKEVIEKYEPRLTHIKVNYKSIQQHICVIYFEISAQVICGKSLCFDTYLMPNGKVVIETINYDNAK